MADPFEYYPRDVDDPARYHAAITPSDTVDIPTTPRALYCNSNGTVTLRDKAGTSITYNVVAGQILPMNAFRVMATGTTASVIGWW